MRHSMTYKELECDSFFGYSIVVTHIFSSRNKEEIDRLKEQLEKQDLFNGDYIVEEGSEPGCK